MNRSFKTPWLPCLAILVLLLAACAPTPPVQNLPPPTLTVDPSIQPSAPSLPGFGPGEERPLASVTGEDGVQADFVADEVWLTTDDPNVLNAFLARWQGEVLQTLDLSDAGASDVPVQYLIRINAAAADVTTLPADLQRLDANSTGDHKVSSQLGLDLISASSHEAASGLNIGMNWVGSGDQFRDRTSLEAPSGGSLAGIAYTPDAFGWPSHDSGIDSVLDIGVAEAWRALDLAGKLGNRIDLAVLDMGFQPDTDWPSGYLALPNVPLVNPIGTENLLSCSGGNPCPWHGNLVVSAAMAMADNGFGGAGPAGPIARPIVVFTLYDFFTSITALSEARIAGAEIANMSYGIPVPWYLAWSVLPFEVATKALRTSGMLIFASAGNADKNVDHEGCTLGVCFERTWYTPCENAGVICVGGTGGNSKNRAGNSNYGKEQVDIFAPYTLWLGPDPDAPANATRAKNGTSYSSPFAAGVAALIWAAKPSQSANQVEKVLMDTAHLSPDPEVGRYVNALGAVRAVLGNVPPSVDIGNGGEVPLNVEVQFQATVFDFEDSFPCCTVTWSSNVDGALGSGFGINHTFTTVGSRTISATATDKGGATTTTSVVVEVVNYAPTPNISQPLPNAEVFRSATVLLRGRAGDRNEPGLELACDRLNWTSNVASDPLPQSGCEVAISFASNGARTLTLTATDPQGTSASATVNINVIEPPENLPPNVQVTSPADRANLPTDQPITLSGTAIDPEGETDLTFEWTIKLGNLSAVVVGNAASVQWTPSDNIDFSGEGTYTVQVRLNVTDPQSNTGTDFIVLEWVVIN